MVVINFEVFQICVVSTQVNNEEFRYVAYKFKQCELEVVFYKNIN